MVLPFVVRDFVQVGFHCVRVFALVVVGERGLKVKEWCFCSWTKTLECEKKGRRGENPSEGR